jgi:hypothetical protein
MRTIRAYFVVVVALAGLMSSASAKNVTITVPIGDVETRTGARGGYYLVDFAVPKDVIDKRLDTVLLEMAVDVSATSLEDSVASPVVGVFPLRQSVATSGPGATPVFDTDAAAVRPVVIGENRKLTMDITDIVKGWIAAPATNHGLVIGTLTGPDVGTVSMKSATLGPGTAVRVTFFYQNRFGERVSSR